MLEHENASIDFDILLFEDDGEQLVEPDLGLKLLSEAVTVKQECDDELEWEGEDTMPDIGTRQHAIDCIEEWTLENLIEMSSDKPSWAFNITSRRRQGKLGTNTSKRRLLWPRKGHSTMKTMAQANKVAGMAHQALRDNVPITKRDIFYGDIPLFGKQSVVDILVDDLAATWGLRRADLNIRAALKGVFFGSCLTLYLSHGEIVRGLDHEGALVPVGEDIVKVDIDERCCWALVVEKEAVFQTLVQLGFASKHSDIGPGIVITGKGYPDLATRQLVAALSMQLPEHVPLLALVDGDPHGLEILATYLLGSKSMAHENDHLVAPRLEWIGVTMEDIEELDIDSSKMIELSSRDRRKAASMLDNPDLPEEFANQLEKMLDTGLKAEIEVVSATRASGPHALGGSRALDQYLHDKLAAVLGRVKEESQDIVKFESLPPYSSPGPASPGDSLKLEPQEFSPLGSQQSYSSLEHDGEGPDVEYLDFDDDF